MAEITEDCSSGRRIVLALSGMPAEFATGVWK